MIDFEQLSIGDEVEVEYTTGSRMKGGRIRGTLTEILKPSDHPGNMWQGRVKSGWCFHDYDRLLYHAPAAEEVTDG